MTSIQDILAAIRVELDKQPISSMPDFTEDELCYIVNKAYLMIINQKVTGHNVLESPFEGVVKRVMDLRKLVVRDTIQGSLTVDGVSNEYSFPTDVVSKLLYPVQVIISFEKQGGGSDIRSTVSVTHENVSAFKKTQINSPWIPEPVIVYENSEICAYVDPVDLEDYTADAKLELTYIKHPERLSYWIYNSDGSRSVNLSGDATQIPEIAEHVIPEIVTLSVDLIIENIESQRVQTHPQVVTQNLE